MTNSATTSSESIHQILENRPLKLGTRSSPLAMAQAHEVADRLRTAHDLPEGAIEICAAEASGDKITDRALREVGGKALWTRELDFHLEDSTVDFSVHSMKDVETIRPEQFTISAILPRADARDVLIGADSIADIPDGAKFGTSSPRRAAQMRSLRPDIEVVLFRGNVATRLAKLEKGVADVTLLAKAGLDRLEQGDLGAPLDKAVWTPAAAQGAIGVETRTDNPALRAFLEAIDDAATHDAVMLERHFLAALGGSCHSSVAAHVSTQGGQKTMRAILYSEDGRDHVAETLVFDGADHQADIDAVSQLAGAMLAKAPDSITRLFDPPAL
ncbi:MAG: hydroxymethylbilane synthase [Pseudomonadota bacterium]